MTPKLPKLFFSFLYAFCCDKSVLVSIENLKYAVFDRIFHTLDIHVHVPCHIRSGNGPTVVVFSQQKCNRIFSSNTFANFQLTYLVEQVNTEILKNNE